MGESNERRPHAKKSERSTSGTMSLNPNGHVSVLPASNRRFADNVSPEQSSPHLSTQYSVPTHRVSLASVSGSLSSRGER